MGVPRIRIMVYWALYWDFIILRNYCIRFLQELNLGLGASGSCFRDWIGNHSELRWR